MFALSLKQPWPWAVITQSKSPENRSWRTSATLPVDIALHASRAYDDAAQMPVPGAARALRSVLAQVHLAGGVRPELRTILTGRVLAVVTLCDIHWWEDCRDLTSGCLCSPWAQRGQWHWVLDSVRPLAEPIPCRGSLGLWRLPDEVEEAVRAQLSDIAATQESETAP